MMDRIDAMKVFVAALDEGSLAGAARKLGRSPAAVSRAVAFLEDHVGMQLLHRTTRSSKLSEAGERYAAACRRVLTDLEEADILAAGERTAPPGTLTLTAPPPRGGGGLRPLPDAFFSAHPAGAAGAFLPRPPRELGPRGGGGGGGAALFPQQPREVGRGGRAGVLGGAGRAAPSAVPFRPAGGRVLVPRVPVFGGFGGPARRGTVPPPRRGCRDLIQR